MRLASSAASRVEHLGRVDRDQPIEVSESIEAVAAVPLCAAAAAIFVWRGPVGRWAGGLLLKKERANFLEERPTGPPAHQPTDDVAPSPDEIACPGDVRPGGVPPRPLLQKKARFDGARPLSARVAILAKIARTSRSENSECPPRTSMKLGGPKLLPRAFLPPGDPDDRM